MDSPPQIHNPSPDHSPTPSPPPPESEPLIQPAAPTTSTSGPPISNQPDAAVIQPTQTEIPSIIVAPQTDNPDLNLAGKQVPKQAETQKHKKKKEKKKKDHHG